jgi:viologen exporter family transport system ATP-binding protein
VGQQNHLNLDLPAIESFNVNQAIYDIPVGEFRSNLAELSDLLALQPLLTKQVHKLSLGERMKCESAATSLHPDINYLVVI